MAVQSIYRKGIIEIIEAIKHKFRPYFDPIRYEVTEHSVIVPAAILVRDFCINPTSMINEHFQQALMAFIRQLNVRKDKEDRVPNKYFDHYRGWVHILWQPLQLQSGKCQFNVMNHSGVNKSDKAFIKSLVFKTVQNILNKNKVALVALYFYRAWDTTSNKVVPTDFY